MIGVLVVGSGEWGPNLIRVFENRIRSRVVGVVDRDESCLEAIRARFPGMRTSTNPADAIADTDVQAVVIATPSASHFELARASLDAGKHIFVEKPLTTDVGEAVVLDELARANHLALSVGHVFVYNRAIQYLKDLIVSGALGDIHHISSVRSNLGPIRSDVNAVWDLACHDIAIANYWLDSTPLSVRAAGGSWINPPIEDVILAVLSYPDDVMVSLYASWFSPRKVRDISIVARDAMATFDDLDLTEPVRLYDKGVSPEPGRPSALGGYVSFRSSVRDGDIRIPRIQHEEPLAVECMSFLDAVESGKPTLSDGRAGLDVVRVLAALCESLASKGQEIALRAV